MPHSMIRSSTRRVAVPRARAWLLALLLSGAAGAAMAADAPAKPAGGKPYTRVLVVGITPNFDQRCAFEYALGSQIAGGGVTAIVSCDAMGSKTPLTRENLEKLAAERHADAVVATRLVASGLKTEEGGSRDTRGSASYKATDAGYANVYYGGWAAYGVPVTYGEFQASASITTLKGEVRVLTQVYSTADASLVYSTETTAKNLESGSAVVRIAEPIAKRLRREKIVAR